MTTALRRLPGSVWSLIGGAAAGLLIVAAIVVVLTTRAFAEGIAEDERLLPGVTVGGVDVGELTVSEARDVVAAEVERRLDHEVAVRDSDEAWTVTARELGATADVDAAVGDAARASTEAGWVTLGRIRWLGQSSSTAIDLPLEIDDAEVAGRIDAIAADVDTRVADAQLSWDGSDYAVTDHVTGRAGARDEASDALAEALHAGDVAVELPVAEEAPEISTSDAEDVLDDVAAAADAALDREVTAVDGDREWTLTPREVAARPVLGPLLEAAATGDGASPDALAHAARVDLHQPKLADWVADVADETDVAPVNASVTASSGWAEFSDGRDGRALDRREARTQVGEALRGDGDVVELPVGAVAPERTRADLRHVLLLRQEERRLYHYVDGEIVADWPVAVGTNDSPTPTGQFRIGAKRHMPTWYNPAPDGWGEDMPEVVEPGPDNPLGVRALNWVRDGRDTLIRFHGTPNVASIGQASSNGCVRMHNDDVVDLYDRVPHGATILSVRG